MALSRNEIQKRSNEKRGVKPKSYILSEEVIALIDRIAEARGLTKGAVIAAMAEEYAEKYGLS